LGCPAQPSPYAVRHTNQSNQIQAMLRITQIHDSQGPALKLEGKLLGPWTDELRLACAHLFGQTTHRRLDLAGVSYVDRAGAQLLEDLRAEGFDVTACSHFVATVLHGEKK
jgi:ABC-type transporter Mla MlaB component